MLDWGKFLIFGINWLVLFVVSHSPSGTSEKDARENRARRMLSSLPRKLKSSMAWLSLSVMEGALTNLPP